MPGWGKNPNVESMKTKPIARPPHKLGPNQKETAMKRQRRDPNFKQSRDICEDRGEREIKTVGPARTIHPRLTPKG
jgi:hypothetical protein